MRVLSVDSATEVATCAILEDDKLIGEITYNYKKQHSIVLMSMIDTLLDNTKLTIRDIDGFVVSKGPGSFTGLRIGMATMKGLSHGTQKPIVSVSTLDALAYSLAYTSGIICPILDALRDNVYTALYSFEEGKLTRHTEHLAIHIDELCALLKEKYSTVYFLGDGVPKFKEKLRNTLPSVQFAPTHLNLVKASALGEIGLNLLTKGVSDDLYSASPIYLRKSQAEREYEEKLKEKNNE